MSIENAEFLDIFILMSIWNFMLTWVENEKSFITSGPGLSWLNWWVSFAPDFQCCYFYEFSCLFYLRFNFDFNVSKIMHLWVRNLPRNQTTECLRNQSRTKGEDWSTVNQLKPTPSTPSNFIAGRPEAALLFWFFGGFRCGVWLCFVILVRYKNRK